MMQSSVASFSGRLAPPAAHQAATAPFRRGAALGSCRGISTGPAVLQVASPSGRCVCTRAALTAEAPLPGTKGSGMETVGDVMTYKKVFFVRPDTTIDEALEILVRNSITGLPVLDSSEKVVGVVSDFDLLSLDHISGERQTSGIFPDIKTDWRSFQEVQKLIMKNHGRVVEDVMTADPIVVDRETTLESAARLLLDKRIRRLPVVDDDGKLVGMFSRGDVIKAALQTRSMIRSVSSSMAEELD